MKCLRLYFSLFLVLLISIPIIDKTVDEWSHLQQTHCSDNSLHFCNAEHHCPVCDYVSSGAAQLPLAPQLEPLFLTAIASYPTPEIVTIYLSIPSTRFLRGPPSC